MRIVDTVHFFAPSFLNKSTPILMYPPPPVFFIFPSILNFVPFDIFLYVPFPEVANLFSSSIHLSTLPLGSNFYYIYYHLINAYFLTTRFPTVFAPDTAVFAFLAYFAPFCTAFELLVTLEFVP